MVKPYTLYQDTDTLEYTSATRASTCVLKSPVMISIIMYPNFFCAAFVAGSVSVSVISYR